jgi:hypothetical protein
VKNLKKFEKTFFFEKKEENEQTFGNKMNKTYANHTSKEIYITQGHKERRYNW